MKELLVCLALLMLPLWAASASVTECEHYATCTQPGEISYICEGGGAARKEAVPAIGHSWHETENAAPLSSALAAFQAENPRAQIMDISLLVNGEEARPAQKLRIALPVADEIPQGMKLVFINALGEIIEIEYEIIDGKLVFEALELGTFALVPAQI